MVYSLDTFLAIGTKQMSERKPLVGQDDPSEMTNYHGDVHVDSKVRCRAVDLGLDSGKGATQRPENMGEAFSSIGGAWELRRPAN